MKSRIAAMSVRPLALATLSVGLLAGCDVADPLAPLAPGDLALASDHESSLVTITFDELELQPVHGLNFNGVTFLFTVDGAPSFNAYFGADFPFPIPSLYIDPPMLEGTTDGVLTLEFDVPTTVVEFGVGIPLLANTTDAVSVELFSPDGTSIDVFSVDVAQVASPWISEARFTYSGDPVGTAVVSFNLGFPAPFAFDNLTFLPATPTDPAPTDPATRADCMNGGWEQYGFRNQGQCVRFVETGKDSR